jgi:hypothetical protein
MLASPRPAHEDCFAHHYQPPVLVSHLDHAAAPPHSRRQLTPHHKSSIQRISLSLSHTLTHFASNTKSTQIFNDSLTSERASESCEKSATWRLRKPLPSQKA